MAQITKSNVNHPAYADLLISENVFETATQLYPMIECVSMKEETWVQFDVASIKIKPCECEWLSRVLEKLNSNIYNAWMDGIVYGEIKLHPVMFFVDRYIRQFATKVTYRASHIEYEVSKEAFNDIYIYIDCLGDDIPFYYNRSGTKLYIR